jgi:lysozyme
MIFTTSARGIALIKEFEGLRLDAYLCSGAKWTIGYGTTTLPNGEGVQKGMMITEERAEKLLQSDLHKFERQVQRFVTAPLNQNQFDALVSLVYNIGAGNFSASTLLRKLNEEDYAGAAQEFTRWNRAGGKQLSGLTRRRQAEQSLFMEGMKDA